MILHCVNLPSQLYFQLSKAKVSLWSTFPAHSIESPSWWLLILTRSASELHSASFLFLAHPKVSTVQVQFLGFQSQSSFHLSKFTVPTFHFTLHSSLQGSQVLKYWAHSFLLLCFSYHLEDLCTSVQTLCFQTATVLIHLQAAFSILHSLTSKLWSSNSTLWMQELLQEMFHYECFEEMEREGSNEFDRWNAQFLVAADHDDAHIIECALFEVWLFLKRGHSQIFQSLDYE